MDVNGRRQFVGRDTRAADYAEQTVVGSAVTVSPLVAPAAVVRVADLLE